MGELSKNNQARRQRDPTAQQEMTEVDGEDEDCNGDVIGYYGPHSGNSNCHAYTIHI